MAIEGVDYAWSRPDIGQLAAAGKKFACRYGGAGSDGKQLDPIEAQALSAAGVAIVANVEGSATGLASGWNVGVSWARGAEEHFAACGMPPGRPIYFSVDFDVQAGQWPAVAQALRGAASVIGADRVGAYGGRRAVEWAQRDGVAQWFWQTYAWSGGYWVPGCHIQQYRNGVELAGATLDLDRALTTDFGQWMIGEDMAAIDWIDPRIEALAHGMDWVRFGPEAGAPMETVQLLKRVDTNVIALRSVIEQLAEVIKAGGGSVDTAAILRGVDERLAAQRAAIEADTRDAVADLGEAGAAGVRAEVPQ